MSTLTGPEGVVLDGWRPRCAPALLAALGTIRPEGATMAGLSRLLGCAATRLTPSAPDPDRDTLRRWCAHAHEQGVEFRVVAETTAYGTSWRATARAVVLG